MTVRGYKKNDGDCVIVMNVVCHRGKLASVLTNGPPPRGRDELTQSSQHVSAHTRTACTVKRDFYTVPYARAMTHQRVVMCRT